MLRDVFLILARGSVLITLFALPLVSQSQPSVAISPPNGLSLLDGYDWEPGRTIDATIGRISNNAGFSIHYDAGSHPGFYSRKFLDKRDLLWFRSQMVNGQTFDVGWFKNGEVVGLFDKTTKFTAKPKTTSDLADFFLIVMTFQSGKAAERKDAPGDLRGNWTLLPDYVHQPMRGIDSAPGTIKKSDGLAIGYDIGGMAANQAYQYFPENFEMLRKQKNLDSTIIEREIQYLQAKVDWRQRQNVNGEDLMVVLLKDSRLIASFVNSSANFMATVDSSDKMADFFLIVLTYRARNKWKTD